MHHKLIQILSVLVLSICICTQVSAAPNVGTLEAQKENAESELNDLQEKLEETVGKIDQLEKDLIAKGEEIAKTEEDLQNAEDIRDKQYEDMKLRIKCMYEAGETDLLEALLDCKNITEILNQAEYIADIYNYDRSELNKYIQTVEEIQDLKTKLEEEQKDLQKSEQNLEQKQNDLETLSTDKKEEISDISAQIEEAVRKAEQEARNNNVNKTETMANGQSSSTQTEKSTKNESVKETGKSAASSSGKTTTSVNNTSTAQTIVNAAYSQLGVPYVWGGASTSGFDCSGLVMYCHAKAGINLSHSSGSIGSGGQSVQSPQPGDVVCYSGHVGIYIGNGQMIHAPKTGDVVKVANVYGSPWYKRYW